jgi:hypothetical protein
MYGLCPLDISVVISASNFKILEIKTSLFTFIFSDIYYKDMKKNIIKEATGSGSSGKFKVPIKQKTGQIPKVGALFGIPRVQEKH